MFAATHFAYCCCTDVTYWLSASLNWSGVSSGGSGRLPPNGAKLTVGSCGNGNAGKLGANCCCCCCGKPALFEAGSCWLYAYEEP